MVKLHRGINLKKCGNVQFEAKKWILQWNGVSPGRVYYQQDYPVCFVKMLWRKNKRRNMHRCSFSKYKFNYRFLDVFIGCQCLCSYEVT